MNKVIFLRSNSREIRDRLEKERIPLCKCAFYEDSEWLQFEGEIGHVKVHGVFPADPETPEYHLMGDKDTFKDVFIKDLGENYIDCGEDIEMFIKEIKSYEEQ